MLSDSTKRSPSALSATVKLSCVSKPSSVVEKLQAFDLLEAVGLASNWSAVAQLDAPMALSGKEVIV